MGIIQSGPKVAILPKYAKDEVHAKLPPLRVEGRDTGVCECILRVDTPDLIFGQEGSLFPIHGRV